MSSIAKPDGAEPGCVQQRPARPCAKLPLQVLREYVWCVPRLDAEAIEAKQSLLERDPSRLRVLTWNVWFDAMQAEERQLALLREVLAQAPDVVCLQEVLPEFATALRASALTSVYNISPYDVSPYGVLMLVRLDMPCDFQMLELPSNMGRTLIGASFEHRNGQECAVMTSHFESLQHRATRRLQLDVAALALQASVRAVLCGDFNFDSTQNYGDWCRRSRAKHASIENDILQEVLPEFTDMWQHLHPEDPGYTFDGIDNPICVRDPEERMRYDRVLSKGLIPTEIVRLGMEPINDWGLKPSDHYGLCADLEL